MDVVPLENYYDSAMFDICNEFLTLKLGVKAPGCSTLDTEILHSQLDEPLQASLRYLIPHDTSCQYDGPRCRIDDDTRTDRHNRYVGCPDMLPFICTQKMYMLDIHTGSPFFVCQKMLYHPVPA